MGLFTPLGTPPNSGDPGTFNSRADSLLGQLPTMVARFNELGPLLMSKYRADCSGTADAIVLAAGFDSLPTGTQVRFRAKANNTGPATINLDGRGAIACRTITGATLPAGYIRTSVDTVATYDGTYWVLDREPEYGNNANGIYFRHANGFQFCFATITGIAVTEQLASGIYRSAAPISWTFPAAFFFPGASISGRITANINGLCVNVPYGGRRTEVTDARAYAITSLSSTGVEFSATGQWY